MKTISEDLIYLAKKGEFDLIVHEDFVLPWTAYTVEQTYRRNKLQREFEDFWRRQP